MSKKENTQVQCMDKEAETPSENVSIEAVARNTVIEELIQLPSDASLRKAKGKLTARGINSVQWPDLQEKYPQLGWKGEYEKALLLAYWNECTDLDRADVVAKVEKGRVDSIVNLLMPVFEVESINDGNLVERAIKIYFVLQSLIRKEEKLNNVLNNRLIASSCLEAARSGELTAWRFVCMPKTDFDPSDLDMPWKVTIGDARYDTLMPALSFDQKIVEVLENIGVDVNITYVFDDWELPFLRVLDLNTGESPFLALNPEDQESCITALRQVKKVVKKWVAKTLAKGNVPYDVIFFSDLIAYQDFKDGIESLRFDTGPNIQGVFKAEEEFVRRADPYKSSMAVNRAVATRIAQYAFEGIILREYFEKGIFLASEYPIDTVWQKLNLFTKIPTLFYAKDEDVKNI